jgi:hypothetical protein
MFPDMVLFFAFRQRNSFFILPNKFDEIHAERHFTALYGFLFGVNPFCSLRFRIAATKAKP